MPGNLVAFAIKYLKRGGSMGYAVVHMQKIKAGGLRGIQSHINREHEPRTNPDVDMSRSAENYSIVPCSSFPVEVNRIIKTSATETKTVRKDAVVLCNFIVTSDEKTMKAMAPEEQKQLFRDSVDWFSRRYGGKNIAFATVHMDETTPHLHIGVVPVLDKKLCARDLFTRKELFSIQTDFAKDVGSRYGLQRGEEGSTRTHLSEMQYKVAKEQEKAIEARKTLEQLQEQAKAQEQKIKAYKAIQGNLEGIQQISPKKIVPGMVTVKRRDFDVLKEQAQAFAAHQEELGHLQELRQQLEDRETRADERTAQLDQREKKIRTLENKTKLLYSQQVDVNRVLEKTKAENKRLSNAYKSVQRELTFYRDRAERIDKQADKEQQLRQVCYNLARQIVEVTRAMELLGSPTKENNIFSPEKNIWYQPQLTQEGMELINRVITSVESRLRDSGSIVDLNFSALLRDLRVPAMTRDIYSPVFQKKEQERQRQKEKQVKQKKAHDFEIEL